MLDCMQRAIIEVFLPSTSMRRYPATGWVKCVACKLIPLTGGPLNTYVGGSHL